MRIQVENLRLVWPTFRAAGTRCLIISATIEDRTQLEGVRAAVPDVDVTVFRVDAPPELVAERIRTREKGPLLEPFLERTDALARTIARARLEDHVVVNDGAIDDAADEVLRRMGWL